MNNESTTNTQRDSICNAPLTSNCDDSMGTHRHGKCIERQDSLSIRLLLSTMVTFSVIGAVIVLLLSGCTNTALREVEGAADVIIGIEEIFATPPKPEYQILVQRTSNATRKRQITEGYRPKRKNPFERRETTKTSSCYIIEYRKRPA